MSPCMADVADNVWLQRWTGTHYERDALRGAGLVLDIGHRGTENRARSTVELLVLHTNGVHRCHMRVCRCSACESTDVPLLFLRHGLWPSTVVAPKMAVTVAALECFHQLTLKAKVNVYDYVSTLHHLTSNIEVTNIEVSGVGVGGRTSDAAQGRLRSFMRCIRQYRYLQMVKRSGGQGRLRSEDGCAAVVCPACPYPGRNLPAVLPRAPSSQS